MVHQIILSLQAFYCVGACKEIVEKKYNICQKSTHRSWHAGILTCFGLLPCFHIVKGLFDTKSDEIIFVFLHLHEVLVGRISVIYNLSCNDESD